MTDQAALAVPHLGGDGFRLAPLTVADAPELLAAVTDDAEIRRWSSVGQVRGLEAMQHWAVSRATSERVEWTIRLPEGSLAGRVALHRVDLEDRSAEIGYGLFQSFRGQGLARRVVARVTTYGFDDLALHRIELEHAVDNTRSCGVAAACGYLLEGTKRQVFDDRAGGWDDAHLHARLSTD